MSGKGESAIEWHTIEKDIPSPMLHFDWRPGAPVGKADSRLLSRAPEVNHHFETVWVRGRKPLEEPGRARPDDGRGAVLIARCTVGHVPTPANSHLDQQSEMVRKPNTELVISALKRVMRRSGHVIVDMRTGRGKVKNPSRGIQWSK